MSMVKLPGGSLRDEIREPLYDTLDILPASTIQGVRRFFSDVQGKGKSLTNLRQNNLLETAVSFRVQGLSVDCQNFEAANFKAIPTILETSALKFQVAEKAYWEGPMRFAAGRLYSDIGVTAAGLLQQHGFSAVAPIVLQGDHVVDINPLQTFYVEWTIEGMSATDLAFATPAAATRLRYVCSLKGLKRRPVQ